MMKKEDLKNATGLFPSPIGELHFSIFQGLMYCDKCGSSFRPLSGSYISQYQSRYLSISYCNVSVPYRGATFLNVRSPLLTESSFLCFRPLSGSYISQYHPRNPMFCLGQIGGLRGKSNFIEMQPFWKVKNSHKSSI